jgi:hypothetical protein
LTAQQAAQQLGLSRQAFYKWEKRGLKALMQALESRVNLARGEALSPRLQTLLLKRQVTTHTRKLANRLEQIQLAKTQEETAKTQ